MFAFRRLFKFFTDSPVQIFAYMIENQLKIGSFFFGFLRFPLMLLYKLNQTKQKSVQKRQWKFLNLLLAFNLDSVYTGKLFVIFTIYYTYTIMCHIYVHIYYTIYTTLYYTIYTIICCISFYLINLV